jgi:hypothetical protein
MSWTARIWLGLTAVFWVAMSVLLWQSEFSARGRVASAVPPGLVWRKMLTAPDQSTLEIRQGTNRIGSARWRPDVGQELATGARLDENPIEGMVPNLAFYTLDFDGNISLPDWPARTAFSAALKLTTNFTWQTFDVRLRMRPDIYELFVNVPAQTVRLHVDAGADKFDRTFTFAELQDPQRLLREIGGPMLPTMIAALGVPLTTNRLAASSLGLRWEANSDGLVVGGNRLRGYRLHTQILERYKVTLFISPVGEILRAEFPGDIVVVNEQIAALRDRSRP